MSRSSVAPARARASGPASAKRSASAGRPKAKPAATAPESGDRRQRVQSAETGMDVLKALARLGGAASLTAIAAAVGQNTAKVHRYLASLAQGGLVAQNPATQHYHLAAESIAIGLAALRQCDPIRLGEGALARLRADLSVTAFIAVMGNQGATVLRMEEPIQPVTVNIRAGSVLPLLWSAAGRAFLGFCDDALVTGRARAELAAATAEQRVLLGGPRPIERLRREVREQGCAIVQDTMLRGISAVAAPILDAHGQVAAVLTAMGATGGFDVRPGGAVAPVVMAEARAVSAAMGWREAA